jgi:predicted O-methyltransferase YrrM
MAYTDEQLSAYLESLVPQRPAEMVTMEAYAEAQGFPIIGPAAGYYCYLTARIMGAHRIFELGSGYGYSTAWFARAVQENGGGEVYHTVWDEELSRRGRRHLAALGYDNLIHYRVSESVQALRETTGTFDLIFNDINKTAYPEALPIIHERLRPGGVLIVDNVLWSGRVLGEENQDASTEAIREFTRRVTESRRWLASLVPIRDGLMVAYKREEEAS